MTGMSTRSGLVAPTETVPQEDLARMREYLDVQSPIALAVWVRHGHPGSDGPGFDHHTMLGVADERFDRGDMQAFEYGIERECSFPGWLDVYPCSEVEPLRSFGHVLWEREGSAADGLDPLDFRSTWEPLQIRSSQEEAFAGLMRRVSGVRRVEAAVWQLWKGDRQLDTSVQFHLDFSERRPHDFEEVRRALDEAGIRAPSTSMTAGLSTDDRVRTAVIYAR